MTVLHLLQAVRRRWLLVLLAVLATEAVVAWLVLPRQSEGEDRPFISTGKLLLRPAGGASTVLSLGERVEVSPTTSRETELWFQDFRHARQVLESQDFLDRVLVGLPTRLKTRFSTENLGRYLLIYPSSLEIEDLGAFHELAEGGGRQYLEEHLEEYGKGDVERRRSLQVLTLSASSNTAESAQILARVALREFMAVARQRAASDYTARREVLGELLRKALLRANQTDRALQALSSSPRWEDWNVDTQVYQAQLRRTRLMSEIARKRLALASLRGTAGPPAERSAKTEVGSLEQELREEIRVFKPSSQHVTTLKARLDALQAVGAQQQDLETRARSAQLETELQAYESTLQSLDREIATLQAQTGTTSEHAQAARLEFDSFHWEKASLALLSQYFKARTEERQALAAGTLVLIERPEPGTRPAERESEGNPVASMIAMLPVGLFGGVVLAGLIDHLWRSRSPLKRIPRDLGIPVLLTVPTFPAGRVREWQALKRSSNK